MPRTLGPIDKAAGAPTGIGVQQDNEGRASNVVLVAYVNEDSPFAGQLKKDDEILEVNGVSVKGDAKGTSKAIVDATPTLTLLVRPCRACPLLAELGGALCLVPAHKCHGVAKLASDTTRLLPAAPTAGPDSEPDASRFQAQEVSER